MDNSDKSYFDGYTDGYVDARKEAEAEIARLRAALTYVRGAMNDGHLANYIDAALAPQTPTEKP